MTGPVRTLVVWCPDWSVVAAGLPLDVPVIVVRASRVVACSPAARVEGVRVHQRRREAQGRCPELVVVDHDPALDVRTFEPVAAALESLTPRIEIVGPGCCSFPTRGPSRYHGGDQALAERVARLAHGILAGRGTAGVGVADGSFAARLAARAAAARASVAPGAGPDGAAAAAEGTGTAEPGTAGASGSAGAGSGSAGASGPAGAGTAGSGTAGAAGSAGDGGATGSAGGAGGAGAAGVVVLRGPSPGWGRGGTSGCG